MSKKIGRNDPCPCGSGLKYKKCCLGKTLSKSKIYDLKELYARKYKIRLKEAVDIEGIKRAGAWSSKLSTWWKVRSELE